MDVHRSILAWDGVFLEVPFEEECSSVKSVISVLAEMEIGLPNILALARPSFHLRMLLGADIFGARVVSKGSIYLICADFALAGGEAAGGDGLA